MKTNMLNITLGKFKFYPRLSQETNCFTADIVLDGKVVGWAENCGHGGCTNVQLNPLGHKNADLLKARDLRESDDGSLTSIVDNLVYDAMKKDALKKDVARLMKAMKKEVLFLRKSKPGLRNLKGVFLPDGSIHPKVVADLKADADITVVFNFMPPADAEAKFREMIVAGF